MGKYNGRQALSGSFGRVWLDGTEVGILSKIDAKITVGYEDVQIGLDVDRKMVSLSGEGTLTFKQINNLHTEVLRKYLTGAEPRFVIEANLKDPSSTNKGQEGHTLNNVSFDSIEVMNWEVGAVIEKELPFKFTPTDMQINDEIFGE